MTATDVAVAAWNAYTNSEPVCIPALEDADAISQLTAAEGALLAAGNQPNLAARYSPSTS